MAICSLCGCVLEDGMKFCPNCEAEIVTVSDAKDTPVPKVNAFHARTPRIGAPVGVDENADYHKTREAIYSIILLSKGSCKTVIACEVIEDFLSYGAETAAEILRVTPCQIVKSLTKEQAGILAQALSEYGMLVQVIDQKTNQPVNLGASLGASLFDIVGNLVPAANAQLAPLGSANCIENITKYNLPYAPRPYTLSFRRKEPVVHIRRSI